MAMGDVTSLRTLVQAVLADEPWLHDPLVAEMPWRGDVYEAVKADARGGGNGKKQLVIGIAPTDGLVTPQPPVLRAIETVATVLRKAGHVVIPFSHGPTEEAIDLWSSAAYADLTFAHAQFRASGEVVDRLMPPAFDPDKPESAPLGTGEVQKLNVGIRKYRDEYLRRWDETARDPGNPTGRPVDVIITPVAPYSAARIGKIRYIGESNLVTSLLVDPRRSHYSCFQVIRSPSSSTTSPPRCSPSSRPTRPSTSCGRSRSPRGSRRSTSWPTRKSTRTVSFLPTPRLFVSGLDMLVVRCPRDEVVLTCSCLQTTQNYTTACQ